MVRLVRWLTTLVGAAATFVAVWWPWSRFGWPSNAANSGPRHDAAIGIATVVSGAVVAGLAFWAGRDRSDQRDSTRPDTGAMRSPEPRSPTLPVIVGEIPREPPAFQPRQVLSDRLARLAGTTQVTVVCALTGGRGLGKTQLAASYARHRAAQQWPVVAWIAAESADQVLAGLEGLAEALGVRPEDGDANDAAVAVRGYLERLLARSLVVFDNATDPDLLTPWLPVRGFTQVVITSTRREFHNMGELVEVDLFTYEQALAYLRERTGRDDDAGARALADEVGRLPLALAQAATVIRRQHLSYEVYLQRLRCFPVDQYLTRAKGDPYPQGAAEAILLSISEAERQDRSGLTSVLLETLSVLSAAGVARTVLHAAGADSATPAGAPVAEDASPTTDAALGALAEASIVTLSVDGATVIMHRLIGRVIRDRAQRRDRLCDVAAAAARVLTSLTTPAERAWADRDTAGHLVEQIAALWEVTVAHLGPAGVSGDEALAEALLALRDWSVRHLVAVAELARSVAIGRAVLADRQRVLGADHPDTLTARNNLAYAYQSAGRLTQAIALYEQNLTACERVLGSGHCGTLTARDNVAGAYQSAGRLTQAIPLYEQNLTDSERLLGPDHPGTLRTRNNLAYAYLSAGRRTGAVSRCEQNLADCERLLGPDHPDTLTARDNLAGAYRSAGRLTDAVALGEQVFADCERLLGADHPDTLNARNNLAAAYRSAGRLAEAVAVCRENLAESERVLADHPGTLTARNNLAAAYRSAGRLSEAVALHEQNLAESERVLGPDHPDTLNAQNNLAYAYQAAGRLTEAVALYELNLAESERVLGPDHPNTLNALNNLAAARMSTDQTSATTRRPLRFRHRLNALRRFVERNRTAPNR